MKTNEFIQTINATIYLSGKIDLREIYLQIDQLRKLHVRLQKRLEDMLSFPPSYEDEKEKHLVRATAQEIREFATEYKIIVQFFKLPTDYLDFSKQFRDNKIFATYWYKNVEVTNLIVYHDTKTIRKQLNKNVEQLKEIVFDPNEENFKILDENGKDLNEFPGL